MFFEQVNIYEDGQNFSNADYQFYADPTTWPTTMGLGPSLAALSFTHISMPGTGFEGSWSQPSGFRTMIHEFGHYQIGALDEYFTYHVFSRVDTICSLGRDSIPEELRDSIMDQQRNATEFCYAADHNSDTFQGLIQRSSVWDTLVYNWNGGSTWTINKPTYAGNTDPGPYVLSCPVNLLASNIHSASATSCGPLQVRARKANGSPEVNALVTLQHDGRYINEGYTDMSGDVSIVGAVPGDVVLLRAGWFLTQIASTTVDSTCGTVTLQESTAAPVTGAGITGGSSGSSAAAGAPTYYPELTLLASQQTVEISIQLVDTSTVPSQLNVTIDQNGQNATTVQMNYVAGKYAYNGAYTYDPNQSPVFNMDVVAYDSQGKPYPATYRYTGDQYNASGPPYQIAGVRKQASIEKPAAIVTGTVWDLLPADGAVKLAVDGNSMADGSSVLVGDSTGPAAPPSGLSIVGGPYSVRGQSEITGTSGITLRYSTDRFCGLQSNTIGIYRYNGDTKAWEATATTLNPNENEAYTEISVWGIYAVFAHYDPQPAFSDVPPGSPFYEYIQWISCHGIASGYSDGFRPNNSSTRGQISKMVSLAYNWNQEAPANGGYTFADVQPGSTFYVYVETAYKMGIVSGYPCGGIGEPCDAQSRPYFRPSNNVTRGQLSKIISNASQWDETPAGQTFEDIAPDSPFYPFIERMAARSVIGGYACGGLGEPCVAPANRPYFRPNASATRGQLSKMIYLAVQPR